MGMSPDIRQSLMTIQMRELVHTSITPLIKAYAEGMNRTPSRAEQDESKILITKVKQNLKKAKNNRPGNGIVDPNN